MSTIYSDAAGNKYLGDCQWGNHDINYPTTNWLKPAEVTQPYSSLFLDDLVSLMQGVGYTSVSKLSSWTVTSNNKVLLSGIPAVSGASAFRLVANTYANWNNHIEYGASLIGTKTSVYSGYQDYVSGFYYAASANARSLALIAYPLSANRLTMPHQSCFNYWGILENVNTELDYYSASTNHAICIDINIAQYQSHTASTASISYSKNLARHYIAGVQKDLLQSGRAAYTISCSDGQTPSAQWATDMWVYDNNETLGYPVIGRVPNMLLGIGTYTYLKPVKIQGSVFPDNGSPWYLPVGQFAGKTLLMRCYSSVS